MCQMCLSVLQAADLTAGCTLADNQTDAHDSAATMAILPVSADPDVVESTDAVGGAATSYGITMDERFEGTISSGSDVDWIEVTLEQGQDYVFTVFGTGGYWNGIDDTSLRLYDGNGNQVAFSGDIDAYNEFSQIEYQATTSGTYYVAVSSGDGSDTGDYVLEMATNEFTVDQVVSQMTEFGWGVRSTLQHEENTGDSMQVHIANLTADGQQLALWALESWGEVMGIDFEVVSSSGAADIRFDDNQSGAFAGPSSYNPVNGNINYASVNVSTAWLSSYGTTYDSYSYLTYLHEIGHALGLMHSGNYNGSATWGSSNHYINDSYQMTVMSYFGISEAGLGDYALAMTPMLADVAAVWSLYGEPVSVNAGNTVWGANSNVSGTLGTVFGYLFDGDTWDTDIYNGGRVAWTITDTNGTDTLDLSTVNVDQIINLYEEGVSDVNGRNGNMVISQGTIVENFIGGSGRDTVVGNSAANSFAGGAGADVISGDAGGDTIDGGTGDDVLYGGTGADILYGSNGNDDISGDSAFDTLYGGIGNDTMMGGTGADTLHGGDGADSMYGNTGVDVLYGNDGNDYISSGNGVDSVYGGDGDDFIIGRSGFDILDGGDGVDTIYGSEGVDTIYGGTDDDFISGGTGFDELYGGDGNDTVYGNIGADTMHGGTGGDTLWGATGNDVIYGGDGDDFIYGQAGTDTIDGGAGDDTILTGSGFDTFIFETGDGDDTMTNFFVGGDIVALTDGIAGNATSGAEVIEEFGKIVNGFAVLDFGDKGSITFNTLTSLDGLDASIVFEL